MDDELQKYLAADADQTERRTIKDLIRENERLRAELAEMRGLSDSREGEVDWSSVRAGYGS
jgi:hypothetical protein